MDITVHLIEAAKGWNWLDIVKIGGAILAFALGLWQYIKAQRWKRVEFVASEMTSFFDDESVKAAMTMLDWQKKTMELYKFRGSNDQTPVLVRYDLVVSSLDTDQSRHYTKEETAIREIFDHLLTRIERLNAFIEAGVVEPEDFSPYVHYWTRLLSGNGGESAEEVTRTVLPTLWRFAYYFGYSEVATFVNRYNSIRPNFLPGGGK